MLSQMRKANDSSNTGLLPPNESNQGSSQADLVGRPKSQAAAFTRPRTKANQRPSRGVSGLSQSFMEFGGVLKPQSPVQTQYGTGLGITSPPPLNVNANDTNYSTNYQLWGQPKKLSRGKNLS